MAILGAIMVLVGLLVIGMVGFAAILSSMCEPPVPDVVFAEDASEVLDRQLRGKQ